MKKYLAGWAVLSLLTLGLMPAISQGQAPPPPPNSSSTQDDPYSSNTSSQQNDSSSDVGPGVARVSYIHGDVSSQRGDNGDWVAVTLNSPISAGDRVATGANSRAELQLDFANVLRMSGSATANITSLSRTGVQVQVGQGLVTYSVLNGSEASAEIDTPNASIHPSGPGQYRILVNSDAETQVIIRQGSADISTQEGSTHVDQGQMITIAGTDSPQYKTSAAYSRDDWDSWNDDRSHRTTSAQSWHKTNRYYTGSEDLDNYGVWSEVPDYGPVWTPSAGGGEWAPYRDGRWVYEPYYGWTWVSYEPWGWAPYHYGRWFVYDSRWVWWPGPVVGYPGYYPVWSPAYVSFFGWGGGGFGVGFGFGFGRFGWLPCGPGDWYHPWFGRFGGRFNTVNITNINNFHNGFRPLAGEGFRGRRFSNFEEASRNQRIRNGVSSMRGNEFGRGSVSRNQEHMSAASFRQGSMMAGKMPVTPSRESFNPSGRAANSSTIRNAGRSSQHFFSGGSRSNNTVANAQGSRSFGSVNNANRGQSGFGGNRGGANSSASVQSNRPGWQHFSPPQSGGANRSGQGFGSNERGATNQSGRGTFSSPSHESNSSSQGGNRNSWQHFTPPSSASRGGSSNSYSRPPLNMRQPIVTPRSGSNVYNAPRGGSYGAPRGGNNTPFGGNSNPRGGYSAPSGGNGAPRGSYGAPSGTYNAPRGGYSAPRGGSSAPRGTYSAPRGGGSGGGSRGNSGGGGSHSGGGHSGGGHSGGRSR